MDVNKYHTTKNRAWETWMIEKMEIRTKVELKIFKKEEASYNEIRKYFEQKKLCHIFDSYFEHLKGLPHEERVIIRNEGRSYFENFITYQLLEKLHEREQYGLFWKAFQSGWSKLKESCVFKKVLSGRATPYSVPHFLQYYLKNTPSIRSLGKEELFQGSDLYCGMTKTMRELISECVLVPDIPISLNIPQITFLGFKTNLNVDECLRILNIAWNKSFKPKELAAIYDELDKALKLEIECKFDIKKWIKDNKLFTTSGKYEKIEGMFYYDLPGRIPTTGRSWFNDCDMGKDYRTLAQFFRLQHASSEEAGRSGVVHIKQLEDSIRNFLFDFIPAFLLYEKKEGEKTYEDFHKEKTILRKIKVYKCNSISICGASIQVYYKDFEFFVTYEDFRILDDASFRQQVIYVFSSSSCFDFSEKTRKQFEIFSSHSKIEESDLLCLNIDENEYSDLKIKIMNFREETSEESEEKKIFTSLSTSEDVQRSDNESIARPSRVNHRYDTRNDLPCPEPVPERYRTHNNVASSYSTVAPAARTATASTGVLRENAITGIDGEKCVYQKYRMEYSEKPGFESDEEGFYIGEKSNPHYRFIWPNKSSSKRGGSGTSNDPWDFKIVEGECITYLEVKTTNVEDPSCKFSENETKLMFHRYKGVYKYIVFRINLKEDGKHIITSYEEPQELLRNGGIIPKEISLFLASHA
jgi:hypothetical protein